MLMRSTRYLLTNIQLCSFISNISAWFTSYSLKLWSFNVCVSLSLSFLLFHFHFEINVCTFVSQFLCILLFMCVFLSSRCYFFRFFLFSSSYLSQFRCIEHHPLNIRLKSHTRTSHFHSATKTRKISALLDIDTADQKMSWCDACVSEKCDIDTKKVTPNWVLFGVTSRKSLPSNGLTFDAVCNVRGAPVYDVDAATTATAGWWCISLCVSLPHTKCFATRYPPMLLA